MIFLIIWKKQIIIMIKNNFVNLYSEAFFHLCCEKKISFSQYLKNTTELIDLLSVKNQYFGN